MFDNDKFDVQTRSEETGMQYHKTVKEAMEFAEKDDTIWKISFAHKDERIRLIKVNENIWAYEALEF